MCTLGGVVHRCATRGFPIGVPSGIVSEMGEFDRPFLGSEAVAQGRVGSGQLRRFTRLYRNVYIDASVPLDAAHRAHAAWLWSGRVGVVAGLSAAAMHGSRWIDVREPAELVRHGSRRGCTGVLVHGDTLLSDEVCDVRGLPVTTPARTGFDLGRWLARDDAVARLDELCRVTRLQPAEIAALAERHPGERGLAKLTDVLALVDPGAESPQESRVRLLFVRSGLPVPQTQVPIVDGNRVIGHADLGWPRWRVAVEYEGAHHWTDPRQRTVDIERYEEFAALGWAVIRVNSELLRRTPRTVVERVRRHLRDAGAPV